MSASAVPETGNVPVGDGLPKLRLLDLFSGIGGFSLGLERSGGFETVAFCEIDPFCRRVLAKHWPEVPCYDDVRTLTADTLARDGIACDAICGGFPCQDLSRAGSRRGLDGERSGLWAEYARLIGELRPRVVIVENVSDLLTGPPDRPGEWFGCFLGDLAALGYDAEWHSIPASAVGAPHLRDRVWVIANPQHSDADSFGSHHPALHFDRSVELRHQQIGQSGSLCGDVPDADSLALVGPAIARQERHPWSAEPALDRVVDGVPHRVVRPFISALGNAVVPQIPELIGRAIMEARRLAA